MKNLKLLVIAIAILPAFIVTTVSAEKYGTGFPGFAKKSLKKNQRGKSLSCGNGLHYEWKWIVDGSNPPWKSSNDNLFNNATAPRQYNANTINQLFAHTFKTGSFKKGCCRVKKAWLGVNGKHKLPNNQFIGNVYGNDRLGTMGAGAMYPIPAGTTSSPLGSSTGGYTWSFKPVSASNVSSQNLFSFALGDDTQIKQTALVALTCCLDRDSKPHPISRKMKTSKARKFLQMMDRDKGKKKVRRGDVREAQKFIKK